MIGLPAMFGIWAVLFCVLLPLIQRDLRNAVRRRRQREILRGRVAQLGKMAVHVTLVANVAPFMQSMAKAAADAEKVAARLGEAMKTKPPTPGDIRRLEQRFRRRDLKHLP